MNHSTWNRRLMQVAFAKNRLLDPVVAKLSGKALAAGLSPKTVSEEPLASEIPLRDFSIDAKQASPNRVVTLIGHRCRVIILGMMLAVLCFNGPVWGQTAKPKSKKKPMPVPETPYELQPYRVRVAVAFDRDPLLTATYRRRVLSQLSAAIERSTGGQWNYRVEEAPEIAPANSLGLERLTAADFDLPKPAEGEPAPKAAFDKQFFLTVTRAGSGYELAGREWDELTHEMGPLFQTEIWERPTVPEALFRVLSELFQPSLTVEDVDMARGAISLRLRAGAFVPVKVAEDPQAELLRVQIRKGSILIAFFRYDNKDGSLREVQMLPWTYLVVDSVVRGRVQATLVSGIRPPLGAKTSKRVHSFAVARRVRFPATTLQIDLRSNPRRKLAGHYVVATAEKYPPKNADEEKDKGKAKETKTEELFKLTSDRLGRVEIPVDPKHDIIWLRVHSGGDFVGIGSLRAGVGSRIDFGPSRRQHPPGRGRRPDAGPSKTDRHGSQTGGHDGTRGNTSRKKAGKKSMSKWPIWTSCLR